MLKLNIGCGETKLPGYINVDCEESTKPDLLHDLTKGPFLYGDESIDEILCIHNIEHVSFYLWPQIFTEFHRLLKPNAALVLAYPEFEVCAKYFVTNHRGMRDFWRNTLYGRQLYPSDTHISPVITSEISNMLRRVGFQDFVSGPDGSHDYYTNLICHKGLRNDKEDVLKRELFKDFPLFQDTGFKKK